MLPFHHSGSSHNEIKQLNVFLVTLNAEIKFQHYNLLPLSLTPLSDGVLEIMNKTIMLVDEIYKKPILSEMLMSDACKYALVSVTEEWTIFQPVRRV